MSRGLLKRALTLPVVSYPVARAAAVVFTALMLGTLSCVVGFLMTSSLLRASHSPVLTAQQAGVLMAVVFSLVPLFAAQGVIVGLLDAYALGRFRFSELDSQFAPATQSATAIPVRSQNPWLPALVLCALVGLPAAALALWAAPQLWPEGLSQLALLTRFAPCVMLLAGVSALCVTGRGLQRQTQVPLEARAFRGSLASYLWQRHVLPQGLSNAFINAWVGVAIFPAPIHAADAGIPRWLVAGDTFVTALVIAFAVYAGTLPYAGFDRRWGVVPALDAAAPSRRTRLAWFLLPAVILTAGVLACLLAAGLAQIAFWPFVIARGLVCGAYAAGAAYVTARWTLSDPSDR